MTLYNVLDMRFVQGHKVHDVAVTLSMSDANFHRKQRVAIEQVAQRIVEMEQSANGGESGGSDDHKPG